MASTMLSQTGLASRQAFTSASSRTSRRQPRTAVCASKDAQEHTAKDMMIKTVGALTAAQLALLPLTGAAVARDVPGKGDLAVQGATKAGEKAQQAVPKGAADPNTRENRNSSRDKGISDKLALVKKRIDADNILKDPEIESGGRQNLFNFGIFKAGPATGVSYSGGLAAAPSLQVSVGFEGAADKGQQAAGRAADKAQDASSGGGGLGDAIKRAAITSNSPAGQVAKNLGQKDVRFTPAANMVFQTADVGGNASFQNPQGNAGGVTQPDQRADLPGNPKRGGDLKDSTTDFAAQFKGGRDEGTPGQTGASPRPGANTPKGKNELQNPKTPTLPNALGGKNLVRDDSESPEAAASGNIAKAQQSSGNAVDSIKKGLGL